MTSGIKLLSLDCGLVERVQLTCTIDWMSLDAHAFFLPLSPPLFVDYDGHYVGFHHFPGSAPPETSHFIRLPYLPPSTERQDGGSSESIVV